MSALGNALPGLCTVQFLIVRYSETDHDGEGLHSMIYHLSDVSDIFTSSVHARAKVQNIHKVVQDEKHV